MNGQAFANLIDYMKSEYEEYMKKAPEDARESKSSWVELVASSKILVSTYVDIWNDLKIETDYVRFRIIPEAAASWSAEFKNRYIILPYKSIVGIREDEMDFEGVSYKRFQMIVARELEEEA